MLSLVILIKYCWMPYLLFDFLRKQEKADKQVVSLGMGRRGLWGINNEGAGRWSCTLGVCWDYVSMITRLPRCCDAWRRLIQWLLRAGCRWNRCEGFAPAFEMNLVQLIQERSKLSVILDGCKEVINITDHLIVVADIALHANSDERD